MWYIFPQLIGLGNSYKSEFYGINGLQEAKEYINHPILGIRLREITRELLSLNVNDTEEIVGFPDCLKLKSSMTLFNLVDESEDKLFKSVLDKYYNGESDEHTLELLIDS